MYSRITSCNVRQHCTIEHQSDIQNFDPFQQKDTEFLDSNRGLHRFNSQVKCQTDSETGDYNMRFIQFQCTLCSEFKTKTFYSKMCKLVS